MTVRQWTTDDEVVEGLKAVDTTQRQDSVSAVGTDLFTVDPPVCDCATCKDNASVSRPVTYADKAKLVSNVPIY